MILLEHDHLNDLILSLFISTQNHLNIFLACCFDYLILVGLRLGMPFHLEDLFLGMCIASFNIKLRMY